MTSHARRSPLAVVLSTVLLAGLILVAAPRPAAATTAGQMEAAVASWINDARIARGLRPVRIDLRLADLAGDRAATMAAKNSATHAAAGSITTQLNARGIQWYAVGEDIGYSTATWGLTSAAHLFSMWKSSSDHWAILMSSRYNYFGVGFAYRSSSRTTFGSVVLTESVDHTSPVARMSSVSRSGTTVAWTWRGWDRPLQTHTAGLRDFDIQYRVDGGSWVLIRDNTTSTSLTLKYRAHGHYFGLRARARDRVGNLSTWTGELRVWVP